MITIVFLIGAINLGLGFALAVLLERPMDLSSLRLAHRLVRRRAIKPRLAAAPQPAPQPPPAVKAMPEPPPIIRNEFSWLFPEWAELLTEKELTVESFPEALLWVASIKLTEYCDQLRHCEQQTRLTTGKQPLAVLRAICADCRTQFADWKTAIQGCEERGSHGDQLDQINQWLQEPAQQLHQVEQLCRQVEAESESAPAIDGKTVRQHLLPIFSHFRTLRDQCDDSLAKLMRVQKRFGELPAAVHSHPGSKVLSRLGLEATLYEWSDKDPDRVRMASAILVDIDHFAQLNDRHGLSLTDNILSASLRLLAEVVRKDRGFDRVAHFAGSTFLVFLGDTALRNAMVGAERVRQNMGAATFQVGETRVTIAASCAVAEWNASETFEEMVGRLQIGLKEAKSAGRNCTVVCGPEENRVAPSSQMQVTAREFAIDSSGFSLK